MILDSEKLRKMSTKSPTGKFNYIEFIYSSYWNTGLKFIPVNLTTK